jgi:hypothetical protein
MSIGADVAADKDLTNEKYISRESLNCVLCGKYAVWSGQRSMSSEHINDWWDSRKAAGNRAGYPGHVLCGQCEWKLQEEGKVNEESGIPPVEAVGIRDSGDISAENPIGITNPGQILAENTLLQDLIIANQDDIVNSGITNQRKLVPRKESKQNCIIC